VRVYIAGPMTNLPQFNFPLFDTTATALRARGYEVVSPAELDDPDDREAALASPDGSMLDGHGKTKKTWGDFLSRDVKLLADGGIEAVAVLPNWDKSRGARLETFVANAMCGLPILSVMWRADVGVWLEPIPNLALYRAWCEEPTLSIYTPFGTGAAYDDRH
jgi:hypothetical protein